MNSTLELRSIGSLLSEHFSGAWGVDPSLALPNATVLRSTDIDDEGHVELSRGVRRHLSPRELSSRRLRPGDILLEASGGGPGKPVGRPAWFSDETIAGCYATSNFFKVLRADAKSVDAKFLLYALLLLVKRPEIWRFQQQTTGITNLKFSEYLKHEIVIPSLMDQRRIAEVLDALDDQIRSGGLIFTKLQDLKRGVLRDLLVVRPNTLSGTRRGILDDFVDWASGGTPSKSNAQYWNGSIPWVTPKDMKSALLQRTADSLTSRGVSAGSRLAPEEAVFIVVRGMILAHTFPVSRVPRVAAFNQDVKAVVPRGDLLPEYLKYWFMANADTFLRLVGESTHGTKKLDLPDLKSIPAAIPAMHEQRRTLSMLHTLDARIGFETDLLQKLRREKAGVMTDLLSGYVRVPQETAS